MKVFAPAPFRWPAITGTDYPYGHQEIADDSLARTLISAGLVQDESKGPDPVVGQGLKPYAVTDAKAAALDSLVSGAGIPGVVLSSAQVAAVAPVAIDASSQAAEVANTAAIQARLNAKGDCRIDALGGTVNISAPLVVGDDTTLILTRGTRLRQADGANGTLITNAAMLRAPASVAVSWTAGLTATITWADHGLSRGDAVWLQTTTPSTTPSAYCGVFQVLSVPGANTMTVRLYRIPSGAPAGTFQARRADRNVGLDLRGIIDYNKTGNPGGNATARISIVLGGVYGLNVENAGYHVDTYKYCICLGAVAAVRGKNLYGITAASDGLKIYGPAHDVEWDGVYGNFGDDACSIQPQEASAYSQYDYTNGGDAIRVKIKNVRATATTALAVLYSSQYQYADDITFDGIGGQAPAHVKLYAGAGYSNCVVGSVRLRNLDLPDTANTKLVDANASQTFYKLEIDGVQGSPVTAYSTTDSLVVFGSGSYGMTAIRGVTALLTGGGSFVGYAGTASSTELVIEKSNLRGASTGNVVNFSGTSATPKVTVRDSEIATVSNVFLVGSGITGAGHHIVENCRVNAGSVLNAAANANLTLKDSRFAGNTNGIVRCSVAKTINVYSQGYNELAAGNWLNISGGALVSVFGDSFSVDVSTIQRTDGSFCFNSNAALGTLGATGRVTCQGTATGSWRLLGDTTKTY